jgi:hypothetical protein
LGEQDGSDVIEYNGKTYHDHSVRTKYKNELKPFAVRLRNAIGSGEAKFIKTKGKVCYVYRIRQNGKPKKYNNRKQVVEFLYKQESLF